MTHNSHKSERKKVECNISGEANILIPPDGKDREGRGEGRRWGTENTFQQHFKGQHFLASWSADTRLLLSLGGTKEKYLTSKISLIICQTSTFVIYF